jgi:CBS domain-containing protein
MNCPDCGYENIAGSETCEDCGHDLAGLDLPVPTTKLQKKIMEDALVKLNPASPISVSPVTPVAEAIQLMKHHQYGCIFITDSGRLAGIFTERDVLTKLAGRNLDLNRLTVSDVMTTNPETLTEKDTVAYALNKMSVGGYRHLPIMKGDEPIGLVSVRGIMSYISSNLLE